MGSYNSQGTLVPKMNMTDSAGIGTWFTNSNFYAVTWRLGGHLPHQPTDAPCFLSELSKLKAWDMALSLTALSCAFYYDTGTQNILQTWSKPIWTFKIKAFRHCTIFDSFVLWILLWYSSCKPYLTLCKPFKIQVIPFLQPLWKFHANLFWGLETLKKFRQIKIAEACK